MSEATRQLPPYLERPVSCTLLASPDRLLPHSLESSLVLVYLTHTLEGAEQKNLIDALQRAAPLAAYLCGVDAEAVFERLLVALDLPDYAQPMMTNYSDLALEEAVEEFFSATWPPEQTESEWRDYRILVYGEDFGRVCAVASRFLEGRGT